MPAINNEKLRELRQKKLLTQAELAEMAGVRSATIADLERGKHRPRPSTIRKIAAALGIRPEALV